MKYTEDQLERIAICVESGVPEWRAIEIATGRTRVIHEPCVSITRCRSEKHEHRLCRKCRALTCVRNLDAANMCGRCDPSQEFYRTQKRTVGGSNAEPWVTVERVFAAHGERMPVRRPARRVA